MRGVDDYLLVSSGVLRGDEPILEASTEMAGELAPDRQSGHGINAGTGERCQVARFGGRPSDLPHALLGRRGAASLRCLASRGAIAECRRHGFWVIPGRWATIPGGEDARYG